MQTDTLAVKHDDCSCFALVDEFIPRLGDPVRRSSWLVTLQLPESENPQVPVKHASPQIGDCQRLKTRILELLYGVYQSTTFPLAFLMVLIHYAFKISLELEDVTGEPFNSTGILKLWLLLASMRP